MVNLGGDNRMSRHTNRKMKFVPDTPLLLTVFTRFPFTYTVYLSTCGINNDVGDSYSTRQTVLNLYGIRTLTNASVCRGFQRGIHQREN